MRLYCFTCGKTHDTLGEGTLFSEGFAILECGGCHTKYLAIMVNKRPKLFKLASTKSTVVYDEHILQPPERKLVLTPDEAMREAEELLRGKK